MTFAHARSLHFTLLTTGAGFFLGMSPGAVHAQSNEELRAQIRALEDENDRFSPKMDIEQNRQSSLF